MYITLYKSYGVAHIPCAVTIPKGILITLSVNTIIYLIPCSTRCWSRPPPPWSYIHSAKSKPLQYTAKQVYNKTIILQLRILAFLDCPPSGKKKRNIGDSNCYHRLHYQLDNPANTFCVIWAYTCVSLVVLWKHNSLWKLLRINLLLPEDIRSYQFEQTQFQLMHRWLRSRHSKKCRRIDRKTAFQLYIVD